MTRPLPTESDIPMHGWQPYSDMHRERIRAHDKHAANGGSMEVKPWTHSVWLAVLTEEIGEVARVICDRELGLLIDTEARMRLTEELTQVGAMTAAWLDALGPQFEETS